MRLLIHPLFILAAAVAIIFAVTEFFIALTVAVILHELAHAVAAKHLGVVVSRVTLTPFGGALNLQTKILTSHQKCVIYLAGPLASLLLSVLFGVMVWLFPTIFNLLEYLVAANFLVGVMNLLPIYPLDGGKIMAQYIPSKIILIWSNLFFGSVLIWALVTFRWWWIFFAVIILLQINWEFKQNLYFDKFSYSGKPKSGKFMRCAVLSSMSLWAVYRMISMKHPTEFVVTDYHNIIFYESDLEQWLLNHPLDTALAHCLP
ncbi:MAG: site-2 protease family protein [Prevotella sp.]|nr:site-2 protease family protein [Prevotella sp.]